MCTPYDKPCRAIAMARSPIVASLSYRSLKYGVWAGVKLPGGQYRKREQLARAHDILRRIAAGEINSRQLPENAALLARHEHEAIAVAAVVLHLPPHKLGPARPPDTLSAPRDLCGQSGRRGRQWPRTGRDRRPEGASMTFDLTPTAHNTTWPGARTSSPKP